MVNPNVIIDTAVRTHAIRVRSYASLRAVDRQPGADVDVNGARCHLAKRRHGLGPTRDDARLRQCANERVATA